MSKIGYLEPVMNGTKEELHGEITTLQMQLRVKLIPYAMKSKETSPDYVVVVPGFSGVDIPIGSAWEKTKRQIGDVDLEFLSITLDDPSLLNALNVAAFKNEEGCWDIVWRRRQAGQGQSTPPPPLQSPTQPENHENL